MSDSTSSGRLAVLGIVTGGLPLLAKVREPRGQVVAPSPEKVSGRLVAVDLGPASLACPEDQHGDPLRLRRLGSSQPRSPRRQAEAPRLGPAGHPPGRTCAAFIASRYGVGMVTIAGCIIGRQQRMEAVGYNLRIQQRIALRFGPDALADAERAAVHLATGERVQPK